ncbi:MAG: alpha-amylase [Candidatus Rifleibacteriota bacterium]
MPFVSKVKRVPVCVLVLVFLLLSGFIYADPGAKIANGVMIQGFGWNSQAKGSPSRWYRLIEQRIPGLSELGVDMIWFPPVSRSVSPQGYLPGDYYDVGSKDAPTFYGDYDQLVSALAALNKAGIIPVADIVINHRCAGKQDSNGIWNIYHFPSGKAKWEQWAICRGEYGGTGNADSGENYAAAPDIDHSNAKVREDIVEWMNWLKKLGFRAWRYDFSKGYAAKYAGFYDKSTAPAFSVGEIWTNMDYQGSYLKPNQNNHRQQLCNWLDQSKSDVGCVFDFTTKGILQVAVEGEYWRLKDSEGKPPGLIGWWPSRAVTFIDNHDTGSQQSHWPFPSNKVMQGYAYILTHPGIPCIFWEHVYDWNLYGRIKKLIAIRKENRLNSSSKVKIIKAENGIYAAEIDNKVAMKIGWVDWNPGAGYKIAASGDQYAVWVKEVRKSTRIR